MKKGGKRKLHVRPDEFARAARMHALPWWKDMERMKVSMHAPWDAEHPAGEAHHAPKPAGMKRRNNPHTCRHSW